MTTQTLQDFAARLDADQDLAGQFVACLQAAPEGETVAAAVAFAAANGFAATPDEMQRFLDDVAQRNRELSDETLDAVAGGLPGLWGSFSSGWR